MGGRTHYLQLYWSRGFCPWEQHSVKALGVPGWCDLTGIVGVGPAQDGFFRERWSSESPFDSIPWSSGPSHLSFCVGPLLRSPDLIAEMEIPDLDTKTAESVSSLGACLALSSLYHCSK